MEKYAYHNSGIATNFNYDVILTGSSMVENFKPSQFKQLMNEEPVKVAFAGARSYEINKILTLAFNHNPQIKKAYIGLDAWMLEEYSETDWYPLPEYLYDNNLFTDANYIFNKDIIFDELFEGIENTIANKEMVTMDDYSAWRDRYIHNQNRVLRIEDGRNWYQEKESNYDELLKNAEKNLSQYLLPFITEHPDVEFVLFFPPYSILAWDDANLNDRIKIQEYAISNFLRYDNVKVFYFQNIEPIVTDLFNYIDPRHYSSRINEYMVECFAKNNYRLTLENYQTELDKTCQLVQNFDYGLFTGMSNPLILKTNMIDYLKELSDDRYLLFMVIKDDSPTPVFPYIQSWLDGLGLSEITQKGGGHIAIVNGNRVLFYEHGTDQIETEWNIQGKTFSITSGKKDGLYFRQISCGITTYTANQGYINLVVYDTKTERVFDYISIVPDKPGLYRPKK